MFQDQPTKGTTQKNMCGMPVYWEVNGLDFVGFFG